MFDKKRNITIFGDRLVNDEPHMRNPSVEETQIKLRLQSRWTKSKKPIANEWLANIKNDLESKLTKKEEIDFLERKNEQLAKIETMLAEASPNHE